MPRIEVQDYVVVYEALSVGRQWRPIVSVLNKQSGRSCSLKDLARRRLRSREEALAVAEQRAKGALEDPGSLPV